MEKVLIVGAKGMLGQELVDTFSSDENYQVTAWDRDELDITDQHQVNDKVGGLKPDIIINSAAYNAVDKCEESKEEFEKAKLLNGIAPGNLAAIAKTLDAVFVHYSTDYVFGKEFPEIPEPEGCNNVCSSCTLHDDFVAELGFDENAKPAPVNAYGESKLMGEKEVAKIDGKYYVIRLSKLFGKPGSSEEAKRSFFDVMLELGEKNEEVHPVKSSQNEDGEAVFNGVKAVDEETSCFTYAPDLANKTKEIIEANKTYGIYHVINEDPCTWYEAVIELYRQAGLKTKVVSVGSEEFPRPAERPYLSILLNTKLNPLRSYKEALAEYLENRSK